jgi:hypothetical protein
MIQCCYIYKLENIAEIGVCLSQPSPRLFSPVKMFFIDVRSQNLIAVEFLGHIHVGKEKSVDQGGEDDDPTAEKQKNKNFKKGRKNYRMLNKTYDDHTHKAKFTITVLL